MEARDPGPEQDLLLRELEETRNALEERTEFLNAVLESIEIGVVACNSEGVLTLFNRASREWHGLPEKPLRATEWARHYDLYQVDGVTPMSQSEIPLLRALNGEQVRNVELVIAPKNGKRRFIVANGRMLVDSRGRNLGAVVAMHDVTDIKDAKASIRESEKFLDSIIENIPNMIFVKEAKELRFVRFNKAGEKLLGQPRETLIGRNDYDFFPREQADAFTTKDRLVLERGEVEDIPEEPISTPEGLRTLHTKKLPIYDSDGTPRYLLGISEDITTKKQIEEHKISLLVEQRARADAEAFNRELQKERKLREEFVATLSHDLRNPISAARSSAELMRRLPDKADARERLINGIIASLDRSDRMLQDLLDANVIRAGSRIPLQIGEFDLVWFVKSVLEELTVIHGERFRLEALDSLKGCWSQDGVRRVLENLVQNAVKYGKSNSLISILIRRSESGDQVTLSVHNTGNPIPAEELPQLFGFFHRTQNVREEGKRGWGLGLALVRGIAEAHGGSVAVTSSAEEGTTFSVILPLSARG